MPIDHNDPTELGSRAYAVADLEADLRKVRTFQHLLMTCTPPPSYVRIWPAYTGGTISVAEDLTIDHLEERAEDHQHRIVQAVRWLKTLTGTVRKVADDQWMHYYADLPGGGNVRLAVEREQVCTAKVVGQETRMVADPNAPKIEQTVDVIEWECHPVLAPERADA